MTNYDILKEYEAHQTLVPSYKEWKQYKELIKENKKLKKLLSKLFTTADISYCDDNFLQEIMNTLYKGEKQ